MCVFRKGIDFEQTISILHELICQEQALCEAYKELNNEIAYLKEEQKVTHLKILLSALRCNGIPRPS